MLIFSAWSAIHLFTEEILTIRLRHEDWEDNSQWKVEGRRALEVKQASCVKSSKHHVWRLTPDRSFLTFPDFLLLFHIRAHPLRLHTESASPSTFLIIWPGKIPPWPSLGPHHQMQPPHHLQQPHTCLSPTKLTADALTALTPGNNDSSSLLFSGLG